MDWIDPRYLVGEEATVGGELSLKQKKPRKNAKASLPQKSSQPESPKPLAAQVRAALSQRISIWSAAYENSLSMLKWPVGVSPESTFLWSTVMQEQAEVLARVGLPADKLAWLIAESLPEDDDERESQLIAVRTLMDRPLESWAFQWLDAAELRADAALGTTAIAWYLVDHAKQPSGDWLPQWLQAVLDRMATAKLDEAPSVLNALALQCELPLLICMATAASRRSLLAEASTAMDDLAELLERSLDDPAGWLAHGATYLRSALASVLRCRVLADGLGLRKWYPPQQRAVAELLKHAARWTRHDGTQLLGAGRLPRRSKAIWEALLKQTRSPKSLVETLRAAGLPTGLNGTAASNGKKPTDKQTIKLPPATYFSEDAAAAIMQSDWRHRGSRLAVDYSDTTMCLEALGPKGAPVLVGEWPAHVDRDGQAEMQLDEWSQTCWFSDKDVDYLEVESRFGQAARVQRQIILFRSDRLLLLADALLCDEPGNWTLTSRLPLAPETNFETDPRMTEGTIATPSGGRCLTLPLYLPEWRRQVRSGSLQQIGSDLVVQQRTEGRQRLYTPLLVSLCNRHAKRPFTWRQLTVGEDLRIVSSDEAAAYRVQTGSDQLLFYRTLAPPMRRTALGLHTLSEFYAGRFDGEDGNLDTLVEVEANV